MQGYHRLNDATSPAWPDTLSATLEIADEGLVLGARTVLVRMVGSTGSRRLALDADSERLNAMLSVAFVAKNSLDFIRKQSTEEIVKSLAQDAKNPLMVAPDGRIYNGKTRIKVLQERGYDIDSLPRTKP